MFYMMGTRVPMLMSLRRGKEDKILGKKCQAEDILILLHFLDYRWLFVQ